jgi:hypothetical protein
MKKTVLTITLLGTIACAAAADDLPRVWGAMRHVMISIDNGALHAHVETGTDATGMLAYPGDDYAGAAAVLNDSYYSSQYGWLAGGFISLDPGESIVIENTAMDAGLRVYEGGMRMMREAHTYAPIFGTVGSSALSEWGGTMRHDWFAASETGDYEASFRVFVRDAAGDEVTAYGEAGVTLFFAAVPAPGGLGVVAIGGVIASCRRR